MLSDEQMSKRLPFSLLNNEQMSNWLGVEHQPEKHQVVSICFDHFGMKDPISEYIICLKWDDIYFIYIGLSPFPVIVANEGL